MRNLVIVRAGDNSLHSHWIEGRKPSDFDIFVSYYGVNDQKYKNNSDYYASTAGLKYPIIAQHFLEHFGLSTAYDAFWFPGDDILTDSITISKMFGLFHDHKLWLAQPALHSKGYVHRRLMTAISNSKLRYTNFVEIMCPIFSRYALQVLGSTFNTSISGWGLDFIWPCLLGYPNDKIGVLDAVPVTHTRPFGGGLFYDKCAQMNVSPRREYIQLLQRHGINATPKMCVYNTIRK